MAEINHRVGIKGPAEQIYSRLTTDPGLALWWTSNTRGAGKVGSIIDFRFGSTLVNFEVVELIPDLLVRWRHSGDMPPNWMGSKIVFELEQQDKQTILLFRHYDWQISDDFLAHCSTKWGVFMMSIKTSIETGVGNPYPDDVHIDFDE
jgi:uncharacterized protein YndB with AHSA1/START domain